jgi:RNA polymerase sigma factor (sigma-70 family)
MSERAEDSPRHGPNVTWGDENLVKECLAGSEQAWAALIDKYKQLLYSIPMKYGASREDAADLFQVVCLELFSELSSLRKPGAVRSWLIKVALHKSYHWKKKQRRIWDRETPWSEDDDETIAAPRELVEELERAQVVRDALANLPPRCNELIRLLFYEHPPTPYDEVARRLSLATGSIGFIRGRCLKRLQKLLAANGFV